MREVKFEKGAEDVRVFARLSTLIGSLKNGRRYVITVKEDRNRRSLDANAYCWVLIDKLAAETGLKKSEIYRSAIREIGGNSETVCVTNAAVDKICKGWEHNGEGWQAERRSSKIPGCTNVTLYYGSSIYDTRQMSRLIDNIVQDCKAVGIETATPAELEQIKAAWAA